MFCGKIHAPEKCPVVGDGEKRENILRRNVGVNTTSSICRKENTKEGDHNAKAKNEEKEKDENRKPNEQSTMLSSVCSSSSRNVILQSACV